MSGSQRLQPERLTGRRGLEGLVLESQGTAVSCWPIAELDQGQEPEASGHDTGL
jgi:hypothetical protein